MNDKEFGFIEPLISKYRRGVGPTNSDIMENWLPPPPPKLDPPSFISRNFKTLKKVLPNHAECIET